MALGLGVAVVLGLGTIALLTLAPPDEPPIPADITTIKERDKIDQTVQLTHLSILTSTNYLGHRIYTVTATLKNVSDKPIRLMDVKLTFFDYTKKMIREEEHPALDPKHTPVAPGAEYPLAVSFENPPQNWNYHVPDTQVVVLGY
jgi:hypothetical protein